MWEKLKNLLKLAKKDPRKVLEEHRIDFIKAGVSLNALERIQERLDEYETLEDALLSFFKEPPPLIPPKERPDVVMFIGPNGSGKTTTIGKVAHLLKGKGFSTVLAAADTFRAGSIEQLEKWGEKIGCPVIKHDYGADPAAVVFDARKYAEERNFDYVLADTAGRQETNVNLMEELKKIKRVNRPRLTYLVVDALVGHAVESQVERFRDIGIDAAIVTKTDTDAGGGVILTLATMDVPIAFIGTGEKPEDLKPFDPREYVRGLIG